MTVRSILATGTAISLATLLTAVAAANAHSVHAGGVQVIHPWAEPTEHEMTRAFPTIANDGDATRTLTGVRSPVADHVHVHHDGSLTEALTLEPGATVGPDALRFLFVGLERPLAKGDDVPVTLAFADGRTIEVTFVVGRDAMPGG